MDLSTLTEEQWELYRKFTCYDNEPLDRLWETYYVFPERLALMVHLHRDVVTGVYNPPLMKSILHEFEDWGEPTKSRPKPHFDVEGGQLKLTIWGLEVVEALMSHGQHLKWIREVFHSITDQDLVEHGYQPTTGRKAKEKAEEEKEHGD